MDAVKFIEEAKRMCDASTGNCANCGNNKACPINLPSLYYTPEERVKIVEEWTKSHPRKTRQSEFLKQFPKAKVDNRGVLSIQPCELGYDMEIDCINTDCYFCRQEYWNAPVK